jgi:hypothetical protein
LAYGVFFEVSSPDGNEEEGCSGVAGLITEPPLGDRLAHGLRDANDVMGV